MESSCSSRGACTSFFLFCLVQRHHAMLFALSRFLFSENKRMVQNISLQCAAVVVLLLLISASLVVSAAFPAAPHVVNCANETAEFTVGISSNSWYILNCTVVPPHSADLWPPMVVATFKNVNSTNSIENVRIDAVRTNVIPHVAFNAPRLTNITIRLIDISSNARVVRTSTSLLTFLGDTISDISVLVDRCELNTSIGEAFAIVSSSSGGGHEVTHISMVVLRSNLSMYNAQTQCGSLFLFAVPAPSSGSSITNGQLVRIEDSTVTSTMRINDYRNAVICLRAHSAQGTLNIAVTLMRSNVSLLIVCPSADPGDCLDDGASAGVVYIFSPLLDGVDVSFYDAQLMVSFPLNWDLTSSRTLRSGVFTMLPPTAPVISLLNLNVSAVHTTCVVIARITASLIDVSGYLHAQGIHVRLSDVSGTLRAVGGLDSSAAVRVASAVVIDVLFRHDVVVIVDNTHFSTLVTSGEVGSTNAANSGLSAINSCLVLLAGFGNRTYVAVHRSVLVSNISDGVAANLAGLPLSIFSAFSTLVSVALPAMPTEGATLRTGIARFITIATTNSSMDSYMTTSILPSSLYGIVSTCSSIVFVAIQVLNITVTLSNTTMLARWVGMTSPLPFAFQNLIGVQTLLVNVSGPYVAGDYKPILTAILPPAMAAALATIPYFVAATTFHTNATIVVENCAMYAMQQTTENSLSSLISVPASLTDSSVHVLVTAEERAAAAAAAPAGSWYRVRPVAVGSIGNSTVQSTVIRVRANTAFVAGQGGVMMSGLAVVRSGTCTFGAGAQMSVSGVVLQSATGNSAAPFVGVGYFKGSPSQLVLRRDAMLSVADCSISGFTQLLDPSVIFESPTQSDEDTRLVLGCNLWDGAPMPVGRIGGILPPIVLFPPSHYGPNPFVRCAGYRTLTHTVLPPAPQSVRLQGVPPQVVGGAFAVGALGLSQGAAVRGGTPAALGAFAVLQLRQRCATDNTTEELEPSLSCSPIDNPLQLEISSVPVELRCALGALIGNILLTAVLAGGAHLGWRYAAPWVRSKIHRPKGRGRPSAGFVLATYLRNLLIFLCTPFPGSVVLPYSVLSMPTLSASVVLVAHSEATAATIVGGIVGIAVCLAVPVAAVWMILVRVRPFPLESHQLLKPPLRGHSSVVRLMSWLTWPVDNWRAPTLARSSAALHLDHAWPFFEAFRGRRQWFFVVEHVSLVLSGVLVGAAYAVPNSSACDALIWCGCCIAFIASVELGMCVVLRPYATPLDNVVTVAVSLLAVLAEVVTMVTTNDAAAASIALAATAVQFAPVVLTTLFGWKFKLLHMAPAVLQTFGKNFVSSIQSDLFPSSPSRNVGGMRGALVTPLLSRRVPPERLVVLIEEICAQRRNQQRRIGSSPSAQ